MLGCFYDYRVPPERRKAFDGADRFVPINYKTTWAVVRDVAKGSGQGFDKATYEKETAREAAEAAAKKKGRPRPRAAPSRSGPPRRRSGSIACRSRTSAACRCC